MRHFLKRNNVTLTMKSSLFSLLTLSSISINANGQQTVKISNAKLSSRDVTAQNSFFHPNFPTTSKIVDPGQLSSDQYYWLGKIFTKGNIRQNNNLLDLDREDVFYPLLDSIDMEYYTSYALRNVLDKQYKKDSSYLVFRKDFTGTKGCEAKKRLLIDNPDYSEYFTALINSKLDNIKPTAFKNSTEVARQIKLGFKASLDTLFLSQYLTGKASLKAELYNVIDRDITITGKFCLVNYRKEYLSKLIHYFKDKYEPNIAAIKAMPNKDQFTSTLIKYYDQKYSGLFVGASLLSIEIEYQTSRISKAGIELLVKANVEVPEVELAKITVDVLNSFSFNKDFTGSAKTENIFCVAYAYDLELETFGNH